MVMNVSGALAAYRQSANAGASQPSATSSVGETGFADTLKGFLSDTVQSIHKGEELAAAGATGKANLQEVVMAVNNAELMMQTVVGIRDKVVNAYQEVLRMPI